MKKQAGPWAVVANRNPEGLTGFRILDVAVSSSSTPHRLTASGPDFDVPPWSLAGVVIVTAVEMTPGEQR